ncbi:MAG: choice-of-anchor Q domain-containing protein [Gemmataceae bacterium]
MNRSKSRSFSLRHRRPLRFDNLEARLAPAVFLVNNTAESGAGSLRQAIIDANNNSGPDVIAFQAIGTVAMTGGEMAINDDLTIVGPGSGKFTLDAVANKGARVFDIFSNNDGFQRLHVSISGMTLANANTGGSGGAIFVESGGHDLHLTDVTIDKCATTDGQGGAINIGSDSSLILDHSALTRNNSLSPGGAVFLNSESSGQFRDSTISGNIAQGSGGGIYAGANTAVSIERCTIERNSAVLVQVFSRQPESNSGGGVFVASGSLNILDSTIDHNFATGDGGGVAINATDLIINNSTISSNTTNGDGGGIYIGGASITLTGQILHSTITGNIASNANTTSYGGGLFTDRDVDVVNTIIANNTAFFVNIPVGDGEPNGNDVFTASQSKINLSFSLIKDTGGANINEVSASGTNIFNTDPLLGPLANNGGQTKTHALLPGSPAINTGDPAFQNPPTGNNVPIFDQRGAPFVRVFAGRTDMGALEDQPIPSDTIPITPPGPPPQVTTTFRAVGAGPGTVAEVKVYDSTGKLVCDFDAYPGFNGGVRVATADINGDGIEDVITGAGPGGSPHVQVFDGKLLANGIAERIVSALGSFFAYNPQFRGGVYVSVGDVNGDGRPDIITGADAGGGPHVIAWDNVTSNALVSFYAYDQNFHGGVTVAGGDIDGDGRSEIITGAGPGGGPHVRVFNSSGAVVKEFFAYDANFSGGVFVTAGDINNDGKDDIITGAGAGGTPHVKVFSGVDLSLLRSFLAYDAGWFGGVRVTSADVNFDGVDDIVTGAGAGGGPHVIAYSGKDGSILTSFYAYDQPFPFGVYVG